MTPFEAFCQPSFFVSAAETGKTQKKADQQGKKTNLSLFHHVPSFPEVLVFFSCGASVGVGDLVVAVAASVACRHKPDGSPRIYPGELLLLWPEEAWAAAAAA